MNEYENKVIDPIVNTCIDCGQEFIMSPAEQKYYFSKGFELPKRCPDCRKKRKEQVEVECVDCGRKFMMSKSNYDFFTSHGLHIPKRCNSCIEFKKQRHEREAQEANENNEKYDFE